MPFPVAFYAPLKPPDHPTPSGDREMARLMLRLIEAAGGEPFIASRLRSFGPPRDEAAMAVLERDAEAEARRILAGPRPALWFTYHLYYKAPDLLGPRIAAALGIPYVVAEGSRAPKRADGPWAAGHRRAEAALDAADRVLVLNPRDRPVLERARPAGQRLEDLAPFIDPADWPAVPSANPRPASAPLSLLAVAMMRPGDKRASYALLADALARVEAPWTLDLVGDGPARAEVEALFAGFGARVRLHGAVEDRNRLGRLYAGADALVWPAVNEAFGMIFLEAGLHGCPAVAGDYGGVGTLVRPEETGLLVPPGDAGAFAAAIGRLAADPALRPRLSAGVAALVGEQRTLAAAGARLRPMLADLAGRRG